ncbi:MAG: phosphohydrolase [Clostridiales bacterium]|nr:phosphohydrolase [Clostridiales bacterium]
MDGYKILNFNLEEAVRHGLQVSGIATVIAKELKISEEVCEELAEAGLFHDIGKLKLGKYLYGRKGFMQVEELRYIRQHPVLGKEICDKNEYSEFISESIYYHHENFDGSGYPENLKGYDIPLGARILRVCDVFAALISERPYREAFGPETAMELMIDEAKNFDMRVFIAFQRVYNDGKLDFLFKENLIDLKTEKRFRIALQR